MANIEININEFEDLLGRNVTDEELEEASFMGAHWNQVNDEKWEVEVYPNRPDLLSVEGLARAYRGYFGIDTGREEYEPEEPEIELELEESVENVRPYIGGAVVRGLQLDERAINGLIQLQEKLHETMGRKRDKLAIGIHDLEPLNPPFVYRAVEPEEVRFQPLDHQQEMTLQKILEEHEKGEEYSWILEDEQKYPVIQDSDNQVLSFPPIINNQLTEVDTASEDVFIDVTGKDLQTVKKALNILTTALAERGGEIESVTVDGERMPDLTPEKRSLDPEYFRSVSGIDIIGEEVADTLERMKHGASVEDDALNVEIPCYRIDVMHDYDLIEDGVIAHGYRNVEPERPEVPTDGSKTPETEFRDLLRDIMLGMGSLEAHTFVLSSEEKLFGKMEIEPEEVASMSNSLSEQNSVVRNWLLPSLMEVLQSNRNRSYPQKFFEVADTTVLDSSDVGASNRLKLAFVAAGNDVSYNDVREVVQLLERELGLEINVEAYDKRCFTTNRSAKLSVDGEKIGVAGKISEQVQENWGMEVEGCAGLEIDAEKLMEMS